MKKTLSMILAIVMLVSCVAMVASCGACKGEVNVKIIEIPLSSEEYAFAIAKDDADLLAKTNEYLTKIMSDGTFAAICNNYFGDGTPQKITSAAKDESKDQLIVATSTGFAPFEMVDENGLFSGIDMEIAKGLAEYLGKELVIVDMTFEAVVTSVQSNICDIGMAGLTISPDRQEKVVFSNSYYNASQVLVVKEDDDTFKDCKTAEDVVKILNELGKDAKVGCQKGTTGESYLDGSEDLGFPGVPVTKMSYDYAALAITAMRNGEIDFVILDNAPAKAIVDTVNEKK